MPLGETVTKQEYIYEIDKQLTNSYIKYQLSKHMLSTTSSCGDKSRAKIK
uniref:Uncharacterized protein n=1 Tax=Arion vulgaris TaxID=1028688 RepID=A0A0B7B9H3_9EUPU